MTSSFKDLFSHQASDYARFRPSYPSSLFQYLASLTDEHAYAWDCATGNGQAAAMLTDHYERVVATDPSSKQLSNAIQNPKIEYQVGSAERTTFNNHSLDLVTAAQAFHWFKQDAFFDEAHRILKPKGVLAFWCYELCKITPDVDAVVFKIYKDVLGAYWEPERKLVEEGYRNVRIPLQELSPPAFAMTAEWSLEHLVGYLGTWSALRTYIKKNNENPLESFFGELQRAWGEQEMRPVSWELALRVGRNSA